MSRQKKTNKNKLQSKGEVFLFEPADGISEPVTREEHEVELSIIRARAERVRRDCRMNRAYLPPQAKGQK